MTTVNYYNRNKSHRLQYQRVYRLLQKLGHIPIHTNKKTKQTDAVDPVFKKVEKQITLSFD